MRKTNWGLISLISSILPSPLMVLGDIAYKRVEEIGLAAWTIPNPLLVPVLFIFLIALVLGLFGLITSVVVIIKKLRGVNQAVIALIVLPSTVLITLIFMALRNI